VLLSASECFWVLLSASECFWVLLSASECFWVLLSASECFWVLLGATRPVRAAAALQTLVPPLPCRPSAEWLC